MPTDWRVYDDDTVACRVDKAELPGFFRRQMVVGPSEFALAVENGQLKGAIREESETAAGLWDLTLDLFKRGKDLEIIFVTAAEFEVVIDLAQEDLGPATIAALSQDGQPITAQCKFVLQVPEARAHQLAIFMAGRKSLATWDVAEMLKAELLSRVLLPKLRQHRAEELWTDNDLQGGLVGVVRDEFGRLFGARGFALNDFVILWGMTDDEKAALERQRLEREEEAIRFQHDREVRDLAREREIEETRLANLRALKVGQEQGDQEMTELVLAGEIRLAEMHGQQRIDEARLDAQIEEVQIEVARKRAAEEIEQDRQRRLLDLDMQEREAKLRTAEADAESQRDLDEMEKLVALKKQKDDAKHLREIERLRAEAEAEFQRKKQESDAQYQQQLLTHQAEMQRISTTQGVIMKGLDTGAADADVLKTMLTESTKGQAISATGSAPAASESPGTGEQAGPTCPSCGGKVQPDWKACPACGAELSPSEPTCPSCGKTVQSGWKACPFCGAALGSPKCPGCGKDVEPGWKACPACGRALA